MTSKTGSRTASAKICKIDDIDIDTIRRRQVRKGLILDGLLPSTSELLAG